MRIRSYIGLFGFAIATILAATTQYSCTEEKPQDLKKQQQDNQPNQDSIVQPSLQDSIIQPSLPDSIVQPPLPDSIVQPPLQDRTMTIAAYLDAYAAEFTDFTYILKHSGMWDALSQDSGFTCFVLPNFAVKYCLYEMMGFAPLVDSLLYTIVDSLLNTSVETLPDSICTIIAKRHLVRVKKPLIPVKVTLSRNTIVVVKSCF